jgi:hypothetical protein
MPSAIVHDDPDRGFLFHPPERQDFSIDPA